MNALVSNRTFTDRIAVREQVPLLVGLVGPSGSGKTFSALRIATGIKRITGGDIFVIDTEARRALHYAGDGPNKFQFRHVEFGAPFGSLDYLAAIRHCADQKAGVIVVDSMSHEHEGPGGLIDAHEQELTRMAGNDYGKRERMQMLAWQKPKAARRALLNGIVQLGVSCIMCFRASEKTKPIKDPKDGKLKPVEMGFTPIAGPEFVYEMTMSLMLHPRSDGVPTINSALPGENIAIKVPGQFRELMNEHDPLSEDLGERLARWAGGGAVASPRATSVDLAAILAEGAMAAERGSPALQAWWKRLSPAEKVAAKPTLEEDLKPTAAAVDSAAAIEDDAPDFGDMPARDNPGSSPGHGGSLAGLAMKTGAQLLAEQQALSDDQGREGPQTPPDGQDDFDPLDWAVSFNRGIAQLETVPEVASAWNKAKADGLVAKLKAASASTAKSLADAVNGRVAELNGVGGE